MAGNPTYGGSKSSLNDPRHNNHEPYKLNPEGDRRYQYPDQNRQPPPQMSTQANPNATRPQAAHPKSPPASQPYPQSPARPSYPYQPTEERQPSPKPSYPYQPKPEPLPVRPQASIPANATPLTNIPMQNQRPPPTNYPYNRGLSHAQSIESDAESARYTTAPTSPIESPVGYRDNKVETSI